MRDVSKWRPKATSLFSEVVERVAIVLALAVYLSSQTASTGGLTGVALDPTGAVLPGVTIRLIRRATGETRSSTSNESGWFTFQFLPPGDYEVKASKSGAAPLEASTTVSVVVTEVASLAVRLELGTVMHSVRVSAEPALVQTDTSSLGKVVNETGVSGLPLVTRNFAQIASLSPGVTSGVYNAGELGLGGTALSQIAKSNDGIFVHGARSYDNNFELDGISVSDVQGSASGSGGIPIPNPDTIGEFKVQTGLFDAAYGRYGGANVSVISKTGSNDFHGTVFEFLRNEALNANDFFLKQTEQRRPLLRQNQFGFAMGGADQEGKTSLLRFVSRDPAGQRNCCRSIEDGLHR